MSLTRITAFILVLRNISVDGSLLLYSTTNIKIPALQAINQNDLEKIFMQMNHPKVVTFNYENINKNIADLFENKHSCYIPNADISFENATVLNGNIDQDRHIIKRALRPFKNEENIVIALTPLKKRSRRDAEQQPTPSPLPKMVDTIPTGPVLFNASSPKNKQTMIYSSKPPLLRINTTTYSLGNPKSSNIDSRETYIRLTVMIQVNDTPDKVFLRFKFPWLDGYWALTEVVVEKHNRMFNLSIKSEVKAPRRFSYHCGGETIFRDEETETELILYDIQAQPDANNNSFNDAYNCVPFTTIPIWSGLFVTSILIIGLIIGLSALWSIKTMDKFDNYKTKQLSITISE